MLPSFSPGQHLYVKQGAKDLSIGDVIVFTLNKNKEYIVHRIISINGSKIFTRGDNNSSIDKTIIDSKNIIGRVEAIVKNGQKITFKTSKFRFLYIHIKWIFLYVKLFIKKPFSPVYIGFKRSFIKSRLSKKIYSTTCKKIKLQSSEGELVKFLFKGNTVAKWWPAQNLFFCKKPFDLIIPSPIITRPKN